MSVHPKVLSGSCLHLTRLTLVLSENGADIHRYLMQRFNKANFKIESYGTTLPLLWKYELFRTYCHYMSVSYPS